MVDAAACASHLTSFRYAFRFLHLNTRIMGRLLGPCFQDGSIKAILARSSSDPSGKVATFGSNASSRCLQSPHLAFLLPAALDFHYTSRTLLDILSVTSSIIHLAGESFLLSLPFNDFKSFNPLLVLFIFPSQYLYASVSINI